MASKLCKSGHLRINRQIVQKSNHEVRLGDVLAFPIGRQVRVIKVVALAERRGPATEARTLYKDLAQAPLRATAEARIITSGRRPMGSGRPTKRDRRRLDQLVGDRYDSTLH